jgi:hypothetical protein
MVIINEYSSIPKIRELCQKISIPQDVTKSVLERIAAGDIDKAAPYFNGLFEPDKAADSAKAIEELFTDESGTPVDSGFGVLAVFLAAALRLYDIYEEMGIDAEIYNDTMSFIRAILNDNLALYGTYTFRNVAWWYYKQLSRIIIKVGTLEFERMYLSAGFAKMCSLPEGAPVLSVHIPTGAEMTREALDESYSKARKFYKNFYPDFSDAPFFCHSWLLSPALKTLLPHCSKILGFQSDYQIVDVDEANEGFYLYIYNQREKVTDNEQLPENTSLQRAVKRHLLNGGKIGLATGIIMPL